MQLGSRARATAVVLASLAIGVALAVPASADSDDVGTVDAPMSVAQWHDWEQDSAAEAAATDWEQVARDAGCELTAVRVRTVVDPVANEAMGAPSDLEVTVVERTESCGSSAPLAARTMAAESAAGGCSGTHGPGTICIGRSGSFVTTSWRYTGSGTIEAYLRVYRVGSTAGCPTGTALGTSATQTYTTGVQRSLSVSAPTVQGYSSHVWRYVGLGAYTDWGAACGTL